MPTRVTGIPADKLDDEALKRELAHLHETRHETFLHGSPDALQAHTERMVELEVEYARRFRNDPPSPLRTRNGSRALDGRGPEPTPVSRDRRAAPARPSSSSSGP